MSAWGTGKKPEVPEAIRKGKEAAVQNLVEIPSVLRTRVNSPPGFIGKFGSASVLLKSSRGAVSSSGGPARAVVELAGIKEYSVQVLGSNNKTNVVLYNPNPDWSQDSDSGDSPKLQQI